MIDQSGNKTAILGMAAAFVDAPDMECYWQKCMNPECSIDGFPKKKQKLDADVMLITVIKNACQDAGILTDKGLAPGTRILISSPHLFGEKERINLAASLGIVEEQFIFFNAHDFQGIGIFISAIEELQKDSIDFVIVVSFQKSFPAECAAVVFCCKPDLTHERKAYAFVKSLKWLKEDHLISEIKAMPEKGISHLLLLNYEDQIIAKIETKPQDRPVVNDKKPYAINPCCIVSSPKSEKGHILSMAIFIRGAMSINAKIISPSSFPASPMDWVKQFGFYANYEARPWIHDLKIGPRRAALIVPVDANKKALIVLEEIPQSQANASFVPRRPTTGLIPESELIALSADTVRDLLRQVEKILSLMKGQSCRLDHLASFLSREFDCQKKNRLALVCQSRKDLVRMLETCIDHFQTASLEFLSEEGIYYTSDASFRHGLIACLFPGLGFPGLLGPYADHLMTLALHFSEVREVFDDVETRDRHPDDPVPTSLIFFPPTEWHEQMRSELRNRLASPRIEDPMGSEDPLFRNLSSFGVCLANMACWRLLMELNVKPDFLFGQSLGELSALCAAGAINFDDFIRICHQVSINPDKGIKNGRLALVGADTGRLEPYLTNFKDVHIAIHVGPEFQILGGDFEQLRELVAKLREQGLWTHFLPYLAIHTPGLTSLRPLMQPYLEKLDIKPPSIPAYSGLIADLYPGDEESIRQIMIANIDHPVLLWQTTKKMYDDGVRLLIQAGGGATMYSQARTNIKDDTLTSLSLDVDYRPAMTQLHHLCAELLVKGVDVRISHLYEYRGLCDHDLESLFYDHEISAQDTAKQAEVRMPFLGNVLKYEENLEIVIERTIDLNQDLFMRDHLFVNAKGIKPDSTCLPVIPMTISLEMMAEAAACLAPGFGLTGFENVRASQWLALLDCDTLPVKIRAKYVETDTITGIIRAEAEVISLNNGKSAICGTVLLGRSYVEELLTDFSPINAQFRYPYEEKAVYGERHLFHGPLFHCITDRVAIADKNIIGTLRVMSTKGMFSNIKTPEFLCDPVCLDGVGQLAGLWAMNRGKHVFPVGVKKIEIYCPTPETGSVLPILIEIKEFSHKILSADVEIQDGKGNVWMRIEGWQDWVFHWPKGIYDFRREPEKALPTRSLSTKNMPPDAALRHVSRDDLKDVWLDVAARFFLHPEEIRVLNKIVSMEIKWQWLMGRIVVKDALRRWLAGPSGRMLHPAGLLMEDIEDGKMILKSPEISDRTPLIRILCSNTGAVASVSSADIEVDLSQIMKEIKNIKAKKEKEPESWRLSS